MFTAAMMMLAFTQGGATAPAMATAPAPAEKKVCRRTNATNSRLAITKSCHTRSEWARIDRGLSLDTSRSETAGERVVQVGQ